MLYILGITYFFKIFIYLLIETEREREAETQAEGEAGIIQREPDAGLIGSPGSRPRLQAALNCCATGGALIFSFLKDFIYLFDRESESMHTSRGSSRGRGRSKLPI